MSNRLSTVFLALVTTLGAGTLATAADPSSTRSAFSTAESTIGELLDNPQTKAILDKYLPGFTAAPQIDMARGMTLRSVQSFASDSVTDDALTKIDGDLTKLKSAK